MSEILMMTDNTLTSVEKICNYYIIPCICLVGMVCNVLNLVVLSNRQMKESPYSYLLGLAVADFTVLSLSFMETVFCRRLFDGSFACKVYFAYIFFPFANVFTNASVWITVLLTMERWVSVKFPLKAKDVCTRSLARKAMFVVFIMSLIINVPRFLVMEVEEVNGTYKENTTEFGQGEIYRGVSWFYVTVIHVAPCLLLITLNSCLVWLVYSAHKKRNVLQESRHLRGEEPHFNREQVRLTITCISICVLFLICIIPSAFSNRPVAYALFGHGMTLREFVGQPFYHMLRVVTNMLVFCNLSLNFVIYCVFNNKFIRTLKSISMRCVQQMVNVCEREQSNHRLSRRCSSTSSSSYMRSTGAHGYTRRTTVSDISKCHYDPCQAMYFHIESYPMTRGSFHIPSRQHTRRQKIELIATTEISDTS